MNDEVTIICSELAPGAGGVADYTRCVVAQWSDRWPLRFLIPEGAANAEDFPVEQIARRSDSLTEKLPTHGGRVLLQYSAYGFDQHGFPRWLLRALTDWKRRSNGRLVIMFHEIWTFWPLLNKNYLVQELHRRAIADLNTMADAIFTSTASQVEFLNGLKPRGPVQFLPVGSNIQVARGAARPRVEGLAVVFGLPGSRLKALCEMQGDLRVLATARKITKIVTIGSSSEEERALLLSLGLHAGFEQRGGLPEREISALLQEASFGVSAQDELSLTKSGTFMALAAHGLNVLSPHADANKAEPLSWLVSPQELLRGIDSEELVARAEQLRSWQERTASWPRIADRLAQALVLPPR